MEKLPEDVREDFAGLLKLVAAGRELPAGSFKPLKGMGAGVVELIENGSPAYRTVYCAKYADTVFILHAFTKTTNGVDRKAMDTVKKRHKEMMQIIEDEKL